LKGLYCESDKNADGFGQSAPLSSLDKFKLVTKKTRETTPVHEVVSTLHPHISLLYRNLSLEGFFTFFWIVKTHISLVFYWRSMLSLLRIRGIQTSKLGYRKISKNWQCGPAGFAIQQTTKMSSYYKVGKVPHQNGRESQYNCPKPTEKEKTAIASYCQAIPILRDFIVSR